MWAVIFLIGLAVVGITGLKRPVIWTAGAGYLYFAIPNVEFRGAPGLPYQPGLFAAGLLGAFGMYAFSKKWSEEELRQLAVENVKRAISAVREQVKQVFIDKVSTGTPPSVASHQAFAACEEKINEVTMEHSPAALQTTVEAVALETVKRTLQEAGGSATRLVDRSSRATKGNLRAALSSQVASEIDASFDEQTEPTTERRMTELFKSSAETQETSSPLDMPAYMGPIEGLLKNYGLWFHIAWLLLTIWGIKTAVYSPYRGANLPNTCILLLIPMVCIVGAVRIPLHFRIFTYAWLFGTWHICMNGVNYFLRYGGRADNAGGQGGESNFLAAIIVTVAPVAFGLAINAKSKIEKWVFFFASGSFALGVLASGSRAGLLALVGGAGYWLMHTSRRGVAVGLSFVGAACFLVVAPESFWERMGTILGPQDANPWIRNAVEPSKGERLELWHLATREFKKYPISGIGPANFLEVSANELPHATDPYFGKSGLQTHNSWLQIACEYGILGILVWGGAFFFSMLCHRKARRLLQGEPRWEWFAAICLGFEAGTLSSALMLCFMSFHWYDYHYWHFVFGPIALGIASRVRAREDWLKPKERVDEVAAPRYGRRRTGDLEDIDLSEVAPLTHGRSWNNQ